MTVNRDITGDHPCIMCGSPEPETLQRVTLVIRTPSGLRPVHWSCATITPWPYDVALVLQVYSDRSAAVIVSPLATAHTAYRDRHSRVYRLNVEAVQALISSTARDAERIANIVYLAQLITLELERPGLA